MIPYFKNSETMSDFIKNIDNFWDVIKNVIFREAG